MHPRLAGPQDAVLTELGAALFTSLPRADQRRKGVDYLRGLLGAPGRKSIRNIAAFLGGRATEQSLHHFVSDSTWDWAPVRHALTRYVVRAEPPLAWVIRPLVIPKAGEHSVGVDRRFCAALGQLVNAQQAVGVWAAGPDTCYPVDWRLHLPASWLDDLDRRHRASIPDRFAAETLPECTIRAFLDRPGRRESPVRPVVLDARDTDCAEPIRALRAAGVPVLARVHSTRRLAGTDPALSPRGTAPLPASQLLVAAKDFRRQVTAETGGRPGLVGVVPVRLPGLARSGTAGSGDLLLVGTGAIGRPWPAATWLTDLTTAPPATLYRLAGVLDRVDRDQLRFADPVGLRDFTGRSFTGWHRHVTLASAAHAVAALTAAAPGTLGKVS